MIYQYHILGGGGLDNKILFIYLYRYGRAGLFGIKGLFGCGWEVPSSFRSFP